MIERPDPPSERTLILAPFGRDGAVAGSILNEAGIQCPGAPAIWKSYTFASSGIGYYTETQQLSDGRSQVPSRPDRRSRR